MSRQMKLLMENFNKFLKEEDMSMKEDAMVDDIIEDILGSELMEGLLKEMFPTPEEAAEGAAIMAEPDSLPTKEESKEAIKQTLAKPEVKQEIAKIDAQAEVELKRVPNPDASDYAKAAKEVAKQAMENAAVIVSGLSAAPIFGGLIGGFAFGPGEGSAADTFYLNNPEVYQAAVKAGNKAFMIGGSVGLAISAVLAASLVHFFYKEFKYRADNRAEMYGRTKEVPVEPKS